MKNFRDFGYLNVKKGVLFRSEALTDISDKDIKLLKEKNIKFVIDLRMIEEVNEKKDKEISGIKNISIPLVDKESMGEVYKKASCENREPRMEEFYGVFVSSGRKEAWSKIFDTLLEADGGVLFHCTQGKDRTGVVCAMILSLFGVDKDTIYSDYLKTNKNIGMPFEYRLKSLFMDKTSKKHLRSFFFVEGEYLDAMFKYIDQTYGSIDKFYSDCANLDEEKIKKLKWKYIE